MAARQVQLTIGAALRRWRDGKLSDRDGMLVHVPSDRPVDLTGTEVTRQLLAQPLEWRERAVERLDIGSAEFVRRRRTLQVRPLRPLLTGFDGELSGTQTALLVLPLAPLPKRPLIDLTLRGPLGELTSLRRSDIADREAELVRCYAREAGKPLPQHADVVLPSLLAFTDGSWRAVSATTRSLTTAQERYLTEGLGRPLAESEMQRLRGLGARAKGVLGPYVALPIEDVSALEMPLLVVPPLVEQGLVPDLEAALTALTEFVTWLEDVNGAADQEVPSSAADLLHVLADYGRQWDLMVRGEFPLDRTFTVTYKHLEPTPVRGLRGTVRPLVVIRDADSNHVTLRTTDPGTRLKSVVGRDPRTREPANLGSTSRQTQELHSFYVWEVDADYRVMLEARLGVLRRTALGVWALAGLVLLVALALVLRPPASLQALALTAGPAAAVASTLLLREPSTLASRLRLVYTSAALVALLVLAIVSTWRFLTLP